MHTYDPQGRVIKKRCLIRLGDLIQHTTLHREYDYYNQLTVDALPHGLTLRYVYDDLGRLIKLSLPEGSVNYTYAGDSLAEIKREGTLSYQHLITQHDEASNPTAVKLAGQAGTLDYTYDLMDRPIAVSTASWEESLQYEAYQLAQRICRDSTGQVTCQYQYDARQ